ncbi:DUF4214 domain-containing protein [Cellulomonas sp. C5510]|uniref:DUF4214 domain-containing protein n=1 Tax=Cellulomonas sp. C5510 TaxID=2871170 RepID=UPI001C93BDA4|nr:DUF4214 domain-containing protein [Cellulomonas sp. C5510]QZN84803.1 DUF4214 domain-containing protein [Cellulomonas sp. C5510]
MILRFLLAFSVVVTGAGLGVPPDSSASAVLGTAAAAEPAAVDADTAQAAQPAAVGSAAGTDPDLTVSSATLVVASAADAERATAATLGLDAATTDGSSATPDDAAPGPAAPARPTPSASPAPSASPEPSASPTGTAVPDPSPEAARAEGTARAAGTPEAARVTEDEAADAATVDPDAEPVVADGLTAEDRVVTPAVETADVQTIGVTWPQDADGTELVPQVRTRVGDEWSGWSEMEVGDSAPDAGTADAAAAARGGTDSFWIGDVDAVQLSFAATATGGPDDLDLTLVGSDLVEPGSATAVQDASSTGDAVFRTALATTGTADVVQTAAAPGVITRAQWGARAPVCTPDTASTLVGAVVHHTAGSNSYSSVAAAMQQIRNDQAYHIDGRKWCDIGYNFIVDKWGNIYEGRVNSSIAPVIGVHAGGFNTGTVGIAMLGTYSAVPSAATQDAVGRVIGWRLGRYGVNPQGSMSYYTGNGENSRYKNTTVSLPRVFGHRDVSYTACPGDGGYAALGNIRAVAAANLVSAMPAATARAVVKALYQDLLGRAPDAGGLASWSNALQSGLGQPELVRALTGSEEYVRLRVTQAYQEVLGRAPEPSGLQYWRDRIFSGQATVDDVKRRFYDSQEYYNRSGGTPEGYVDLLYQTMFERSASASERSYWSGQIGVVGRSRVVDSIWFSTEAAMWRAGKYYETFLRRTAEWNGRVYWAGILQSSGEGAIREGIAGSTEYRNLAVKNYPS